MRSIRLSRAAQPFLLSIALTLCLLSNAQYAVFSNQEVHTAWRQVGKPDKDHEISLKIGIRYGAFEGLEKHLYEANDPSHQLYGMHLSETDTHQFTTPQDESLAAVEFWLSSHGLNLSEVDYSPSYDWLTIALPLWKVESLLNTKYNVYVDGSGRHMIRTSSYSVPLELHEHIDVIQPTNHFGSPVQLQQQPFSNHEQDQQSLKARSTGRAISDQRSRQVKAACTEPNVTISCLRTLYRTVDYVPQVPERNSLATTNWFGETAKYSDLRLWLRKFRPDADPYYAFTYHVIANGTNNQSAAYKYTYEANIDIQIAAGFAYPTRLLTYTTGGDPAPWQYSKDAGSQHPHKNTNEPYLTFLESLRQKPNEEIPHIIATSYGEDEDNVPPEYARRVCQELAILSARGVTLLFGSGDTGVGPNKACGSSDRFRTFFPASCPYVTAVGGTSSYLPEVVGVDGTETTTGGGFSKYFKRPRYQNQAVEQYLGHLGRIHAGKYNRTGRAYPDIAAQSARVVIVDGGEIANATGTSVAVQVAAGVLANVNDALLAAGRPPLGFLNPWLYTYGLKAGFNDVTVGSVPGCNTSGFQSAPGWDVASGWGTPDFRDIVDALLRSNWSRV